MTLVEQLSQLHRDIPGCRAVVFGDIATGTVLRVCADPTLHQEDHDSLLREAALCLGATVAFPRTSDGAAAEIAQLCQASLQDATRTSLFLRDGDSADDVLCITVDSATPVSEIHTAFQKISGGDD